MERRVVIKANRLKSSTVYHSNPQVHQCKPASWGSHLSKSRLQEAQSFSRPPLLRVPPTCRSREKDVCSRMGCPRSASFSALITPVRQFSPCCNSRELCCLVRIWWEIDTEHDPTQYTPNDLAHQEPLHSMKIMLSPIVCVIDFFL